MSEIQDLRDQRVKLNIKVSQLTIEGARLREQAGVDKSFIMQYQREVAVLKAYIEGECCACSVTKKEWGHKCHRCTTLDAVSGKAAEMGLYIPDPEEQT